MLYDGRYTYLVGHGTLGWEGARSPPMSPVMWTYVLPDALGSVRQETDATGAVTAAREWSPYGVEVGSTQAGLGLPGNGSMSVWGWTSRGVCRLQPSDNVKYRKQRPLLTHRMCCHLATVNG